MQCAEVRPPKQLADGGMQSEPANGTVTDNQNSERAFAQEIAVDSLRHSDWTVTVRRLPFPPLLSLAHRARLLRSWC